MAGLLQSVITGIIPGNRNSEYVQKQMNVTIRCWIFFQSNIDSHFQDRQFLMFPSKSIHTDGVRAGVMVRL